MGTWFHDLSYDFEGSRYYSKITDYQLDFSHRSRRLKLDIEDQIQKLRKVHQNAENQLEEVYKEKRALAGEE